MSDDLIRTDKFRETLIRVLLEIPDRWSSDYWHESTGIEQSAIRRLINAGLAELMVNISFETTKGLFRRPKQISRCFICSGRDAMKRAAQQLGVSNEQVTMGNEVFRVRLSDQGAIARDDLLGDDCHMKDYTVKFALNRFGETTVIEVNFQKDVDHHHQAGVKAQAFAAAQANASIGDIVIHNHIEPAPVCIVPQHSEQPARPKSKVQQRREILRELRSQHNTGNQWAKLRDIANQDPRIRELFPGGIKYDDVTNDLKKK